MMETNTTELNLNELERAAGGFGRPFFVTCQSNLYGKKPGRYIVI